MKLFEIEDGGTTWWYGADDLESARELFRVDLVEMIGAIDAAETMLDIKIMELAESVGRERTLHDSDAEIPMWEAMLAMKQPGQIACSEY